MNKGTAPAWQVREIAWEKVLDEIKRALQNKEEEFENRLDLYRLVMMIVDMKLSSGTLLQRTLYLFPDILWRTRFSVFKILTTADTTIKDFQRAPEEGLFLWAELLTWTTTQITETHLSALQALEESNPQLIFGAETAMTEVPIE